MISPCINLYKSLTIEDINDSTELPKLYALIIAFKNRLCLSETTRIFNFGLNTVIFIKCLTNFSFRESLWEQSEEEMPCYLRLDDIFKAGIH